MQAVVSVDSHDLLANAHIGGRHRSVSDAFPPAQRNAETYAESPQLPKSASYTYFPRVKDLDDPVLGVRGRISEDELKPDGAMSTSSDGSSPDSEDGNPHEQTPQLKPQLRASRRSSRFLPSFSSKSRDSSESRRSRHETVKQPDTPSSMSPSRSLSRLRRKSWISSHSRPSSPTKEKDVAGKTEETGVVPDISKRRSLTAPLSIADKSGTKDVTQKDVTETSSNSKGRVLTKKTKRPLSGLFTTSTNQQVKPGFNAPQVPQIPKSFSTDKLPSFANHPAPPTPTHAHIPPLPRNISTEKLKGGRTEPRKKDELWTVFRTLEADLRK